MSARGNKKGHDLPCKTVLALIIRALTHVNTKRKISLDVPCFVRSDII